MKNTVKIAVIAVTGVVLITCVILSTLATDSGRAVVHAAAQQTVSDEARHFVIGERRGRRAVWRKGESEPFMMTDTPVGSLPKADRSKLAKGLEIIGESELRRTLEDYCS